MQTSNLLTTLALAAALCASSANACGPDPCEVDKLRPTMSDCSWGISILTPQNDSRQNLLLLVSAYFRNSQDLSKIVAPPQGVIRDLNAAQFSAEACQTNTPDNVLLFSKAVDNVGLAQSASSELKVLRDHIAVGCSKINLSAQELEDRCKQIETKDSKAAPFCRYIRGAYYLYSVDRPKALEQFKSLTAEANDWLRETSQYLIGRVGLIAAQTNWDGYYIDPTQNKIDLNQITTAVLDLKKYIEGNPSGMYVNSAKGLLRRASWMVGDKKEALNALEDAIEDALTKHDDAALSSRIYESDIIGIQPTVSGLAIERPLLGATSFLVLARGAAEISTQQNEVIERVFSDPRFPGLKQYLRALAYFNASNLEGVKRERDALPQSTPSLVRQSLEAVYANAQEKNGDWKGARSIWQSLRSDPVHSEELRAEEIRNYICAGDLSELISKHEETLVGSWDDSIAFQENAVAYEEHVVPTLSQFASENLLLQLVADPKSSPNLRNSAVMVLLQKYLLERSFEKFISLFEKEKAQQTKFEGVETAARSLTKDPNDPKALINYSYFLHTNLLYKLAPEDEFLTACKSAHEEWKVNAVIPFRTYEQAYTEAKKRNDKEQQAKSLHFMIRCFGSTNWGYDCLDAPFGNSPGGYPDKEERRKWFQRLHTEFKNSEWAKKTPLYF